jgi:hypothetical protein
MNVLHLVLGCKNNNYSKIEESAKNTWVKIYPDNIKTIFMYGDSSKIYWDDKDSFYVNLPESHQYNICLYKTITAFEIFIESNFDYIYRTNNTGYFDLNLTSEFLENKPRTNFYCGNIQLYERMGSAPIQYASGASFFLSRDIVEKIIENKELIYSYDLPGWCDDVMIGKFITEYLNIDINNSSKRLLVNLKNNELCCGELTYKIDDKLDMNHYFYRITEKYVENKIESLYKIHSLKEKFHKGNL